MILDVARLDYFTIGVRSVEVSAGFYERVLGLRPISASTHFALLKAPNIHLGLHASPNGQIESSINLHFLVPDLTEAHRRLEEAGIANDGPPQEQPWGLQVVSFRDPDGNRVELVEVQISMLGQGNHRS